MKRSAAILGSSLVVLVVVAAAVTMARSDAPAPGLPAFDKLKSLAGEWKGKSPEGDVSISFRVISGGSAVLEEISHGDMITIYHRDGDHVMMTHYCEAQNQPRMRTEALKGDANSLKFAMLDITGLSKPTDGHMKGLTMSFQDANHISEEWVFAQDGKDKAETFSLERVR